MTAKTIFRYKEKFDISKYIRYDIRPKKKNNTFRQTVPIERFDTSNTEERKMRGKIRPIPFRHRHRAHLVVPTQLSPRLVAPDHGEGWVGRHNHSRLAGRLTRAFRCVGDDRHPVIVAHDPASQCEKKYGWSVLPGTRYI